MSDSLLLFKQKIVEAYDDQKWLLASNLLDEFNNSTSEAFVSNNELQLPPNILNDIVDTKFIDEALSAESHEKRAKKRKEASKNKEVNEAQEWILATDSDGIQVDYRDEPNISLRSVAVCLEVQASALSIVPIMYEADLLPHFMPKFMGLDVKILENRGIFGKLVYMKLKMPFPFKNRYIVFDASAVDIVDERDGFLILIRSEDPSIGKYDLPESSIGAVRAEINLAGAVCRPTGIESHVFSNVMNIDLKMPGYIVPSWLINYLTKKVVWYAFDTFRAKAAEFQNAGLPSEYAERIDIDSTGVYKNVSLRLERSKFPPLPIKIAT